MAAPRERPPRRALVLAGGGARGAYEAGVLAHLFEHVYPRLPAGFEFDIVSGTSVGAVHAAYLAATSGMAPAERAAGVVAAWSEMQIRELLRLRMTDLVGLPARLLGFRRRVQRISAGDPEDAIGGLVDIRALESLIAERVPWSALRGGLSGNGVGALCISCTEVRSGYVTIFMDGPLVQTAPWSYDPNARAIRSPIDVHHVRASAAIPFLFPAVRIGERYYVDGGLRMNTPLSPALRLEADRVLVVALKHQPPVSAELPAYPEEVITQPAFVLGKVLNALMLDQLEYDLGRASVINALLERGEAVFGADFLPQINVAVREQRGVDYRRIDATVVRPEQDIGAMAAECYGRADRGSMGMLGELLARIFIRDAPTGEADLLSYLYFDQCFTTRLIEMGRADARAAEDEILELLLAP